MAVSGNKKFIVCKHGNAADYNAALDREQNYLGERIAEARNRQGLSLVEFQKLLTQYGVNVSNSAINKWEVGKTTPNAYQLLAIGQALHIDVDFSFFMNGVSQLNQVGIDKLYEYRKDLIATGLYRPVPKIVNTIKYITMPVSNLAVSAGTGAFLDEGNFESVDFPEASVPSNADFAVRVSGDSMEPTYHDGQIVWVQLCDTVSVGQVGIFIYDGEGFIKMYQEVNPSQEDIEEYTDSNGVVHNQPVLVSFNQKYDPRKVSAATGFQVVGRVL